MEYQVDKSLDIYAALIKTALSPTEQKFCLCTALTKHHSNPTQ